MLSRGFPLIAVLALFLPGPAGCHRAAAPAADAPPDARRAMLRSEADLATERAEQIEQGRVVANTTPLVEAERRQRAARAAMPPPIQPPAGAIRSDVLLVNDIAITVDEVLYPLRKPIEQARAAQTPRGFNEQVRRLVQQQVRGEIGRHLVYEKAVSALQKPQIKHLEEFAQHEVDQRVTSEFGGSKARLSKHLSAYGLTLDAYKLNTQRAMLVSSYTREMLLPQVHITQGELLAAYRANHDRFSKPATRELLMIELPFDKFVNPGVEFDALSNAGQAPARLAAMRAARKAHAALAEQPFADVAREFSRGAQAQHGGSWGQIGQPLQPPYDEVSARVFELESGGFTEPIETEHGWFIIGCGKIVAARNDAFSDVQAELRTELENQKFGKLAGDYIFHLAEKATIDGLNSFIAVAVERATRDGWPSVNR